MLNCWLWDSSGQGGKGKLKHGMLQCYLQLYKRPSTISIFSFGNKEGTIKNNSNDLSNLNGFIEPSSWAEIKKESPLARKILKKVVFLSPDCLTTMSTCAQLALWKENTPASELEKAMETLVKFKVISIHGPLSSPETLIEIHPTVQFYTLKNGRNSGDLTPLFKLCRAFNIILKRGQILSISLVDHAECIHRILIENRQTLPMYSWTNLRKCEKYERRVTRERVLTVLSQSLCPLLEEILKSLLYNSMSISARVSNLNSNSNFEISKGEGIKAGSIFKNHHLCRPGETLYEISYGEFGSWVMTRLMLYRSYSHLVEYGISSLRILAKHGVWPQVAANTLVDWATEYDGEKWEEILSYCQQYLLSSDESNTGDHDRLRQSFLQKMKFNLPGWDELPRSTTIVMRENLQPEGPWRLTDAEMADLLSFGVVHKKGLFWPFSYRDPYSFAQTFYEIVKASTENPASCLVAYLLNCAEFLDALRCLKKWFSNVYSLSPVYSDLILLLCENKEFLQKFQYLNFLEGYKELFHEIWDPEELEACVFHYSRVAMLLFGVLQAKNDFDFTKRALAECSPFFNHVLPHFHNFPWIISMPGWEKDKAESYLRELGKQAQNWPEDAETLVCLDVIRSIFKLTRWKDAP